MNKSRASVLPDMCTTHLHSSIRSVLPQRADLWASVSKFALGERFRGVFVTDQDPSARKAFLPFVILALLALGVAGAVWWVTRPGPVLIQGEVAAPRVDVSARVSGRVAEVTADLGHRVEAGVRLVTLSNPQLVTAYATAASGLEVARASKAASGATRPELIRAREADLALAQADLLLAQEQFARDTELSQKGQRSQALLDQSTRNVETATRRAEAAQAQLDLARAGASPEERALAAAQVAQAEATLAQRQADLDELTVNAPMAGEISARLIEPGENIGPGTPLFTIVDLNSAWFTFNLREDLLAGLKIGDLLRVRVPALNVEVDTEITLINVQGQFASWRATRATGDFDLRSFELRARATAPLPGLRPGMSALIMLGN
jgi:HlyD family secretion protein